MSKVILQPKASVPFKHSLVCQLPAVSRDRGLSEAIATDFLFEAIQLVTCEVTFSFPVFPPPPPPLLSHIIWFPLLFSQGKIWIKKFQKKQKWKFKQQPPPSPPLPKKTGTIWLFCTGWPNFGRALFLDNNKQPLSFIGRDYMKKTSYVHRMWLMWHYGDCLWGVWLFLMLL